MGKKVSLYDQSLKLLKELHTQYPTRTLGEHLATAFADHGHMWAVTDREFLFTLEKYKTEMELNIVSDKEIERIVLDAQDLDKLFTEEEEDYDT